MAAICTHHTANPVKGYNDCVVCELEYYKELAKYHKQKAEICKDQTEIYKKLFEESLEIMEIMTKAASTLAQINKPNTEPR